MQYSVERQIGGKNITIETGKLAGLAGGAVTVRCGDTIVLATVCMSSRPRPNIDFLPLTVDYEERIYAAGRIPGSFFRREGRPGQEAILFGRLIDRPMRPLFPKSLRNEVQIILTVLSVDKENPPEILAMIGASAAVAISEIPFDGPVGATRIGHVDGGFVLNPEYAAIDSGDLAVVVAGTRDAVMMIEAASVEVSEETVLDAINQAQEANLVVIDMIEEMVRAVGKSKTEMAAPAPSDTLDRELNNLLDGRLTRIVESGAAKEERDRALAQLEDDVRGKLAEEYSESDVAAAFESSLKKQTRARILEKGIRADGRGLKDIRPISCEVGVLPRVHGSGLFSRGQTQVLTIATLASTGMRQRLDNLSPEETKRYMHHYNFSPYSTGETKRIFTGRREVGHGALAEKAVYAAIPSEEEFPYAIRLVSEVLSSNGSTSMASVCGSTLALMDAGVPLRKPVAGVAMGLILGENEQAAVLTDIDLAVQPGETVALVGPSGAGKSTILDLIQRFYDPTDGVVAVAGVDARELALETLRGEIAFVPQNPVLFADTVRENVRYGDASASDARVQAALRAAHATDFVDALEAGLDTRVGEDGQGLSGGQRQRLAIARALLPEPRILLMDEATSALDALSEQAIRQTIAELKGRCTIVIVAHRLSTVAHADRIVVLAEGGIVAEGTHEALLRENGLYRDFAKIQLVENGATENMAESGRA